MDIRPQPGPQEQFLATPADIAFFGGSAGGGKSFAMLLEAIRHRNNPKFTAAFLRRKKTDLLKPGGLWDTSCEIYPLVGAKSSGLTWTFASGATVSMDGMEHEKDRFNWQGTQIALIGFDEATHFTEAQFWYMLSRNRSASGIPGYIRAGCNPDPDSFVRTLIDWWIGPDGLPIKERSGVLRWFVRIGGEMRWADSKAELIEEFGKDEMGQEVSPKSLTFIRSSIFDNRILLDKDPSYLANLKALSKVDRAQLLDGNWNIRAAAGLYFQRQWFGEPLDRLPEMKSVCRFWDRASTPGGGDWTVGLKLGRDADGICYVMDVRRFQGSPLEVEKAILQCAQGDARGTMIVLEQEPGSSGVATVDALTRLLMGYRVTATRPTGSKGDRAKPVSAYAEARKVRVLRAPWNDAFFTELENFDGSDKGVDDQVDGLSGAFNELANERRILVA